MKRILIVLLIIAAMLMPGLYAVGSSTDGDLTISDSEVQEGSGDAAQPEPHPLYAYAGNLSQGLALHPEKALNFDDWDSFDGLDELLWELPVDPADDDNEQTHAFRLLLRGNRFALQYQIEDSESDDEYIFTRVHLAPHKDDPEEGEDADDAEEDEAEDLEEASPLVILSIDSDGNPARAPLLPDADGYLPVLVVFAQPPEGSEDVIALIPADFLIMYDEYNQARLESERPAEAPVSPDPDDDDEPQSDWARIINEMQALAPLDGYLADFVDDGAAQIVVNVRYSQAEQAWAINTEASPPLEVFPADFEVLDTSGNSFALIGFIVLMLVSICALFVNVLLAIKRSRG